MEDLSHLTHGKYKPWMVAAALGLSVLVYMYYKHSSAGSVAATATDATATDPTSGTDTSGGADSALGSPSAGTSTTYVNNYYTTPKPSSTPKPKPKHAPTPKKPVKPASKSAKAHSEVMSSHPSTHGARTYTVRSGDTLSSIAARFTGSASNYRTLAKDNGIANPNLIRVGQVIRIPAY